tara:strand:- start:4022 stop:4582 length:561 start_codon:yes stop_codon:yes gene_type:complete
MTTSIVRALDVHRFLYVYRNDDKAYWWCAVPFLDRTGRRKQRRQRFRDRVLGSKVAALQCATAWRDEQVAMPDVRAAMGDQRRLSLYMPAQVAIESASATGIVGVTSTFRLHPLGGNFSVTAHRGRKKWFSMRRYGCFKAFALAVELRCAWIGVPMIEQGALTSFYRDWIKRNQENLRQYRLEAHA